MSEEIGSNWAFKMMSLIHDNPIRRKFSNPEHILREIGLKPGMIVLEVGCGPGFFSIPAANILKQGKLYANDIHPSAIECVKNKILEKKIDNIELLFASITSTGLANECIDLVFLFGVPRMLRNEVFFDKVLDELYRILKFDGIVAIKSSRKNMPTIVGNKGFSLISNKSGIYLFSKEKKVNAK